MLKNYLTIAWRNLRKNRMHSLINISGLAIGMTVALLIGLWIWDELSFNSYDPHYKRVAAGDAEPDDKREHDHAKYFDGAAGGTSYGTCLWQQLQKRVVMESWSWSHILSTGDKNLLQGGIYMEEEGPELFGLTMVAGSKRGFWLTPSSLCAFAISG